MVTYCTTCLRKHGNYISILFELEPQTLSQTGLVHQPTCNARSYYTRKLLGVESFIINKVYDPKKNTSLRRASKLAEALPSHVEKHSFIIDKNRSGSSHINYYIKCFRVV